MAQRLQSGRAKRWLKISALPLMLAALVVMLVCGAFDTPRLVPWALLAVAALHAIARWGFGRARGTAQAAEVALLCEVAVLALAQLAPPLQPLMYLLSTALVLALPVSLAVPLLAALVALDACVTKEWPVLLAHGSFTALFASLYHALLGARLVAARRKEERAVRLRIAEAEERARELRLVATSSDAPEERYLLGGVAELEQALRGALAVAEAALRPHSVAVFLLAHDGETVRLRECASRSERLIRGPLHAREGAVGAVLAAQRPVRLHSSRAALSYYEGGGPVGAFCGIPLAEGVLVADREQPFSDDEEKVLVALGAQVERAIGAERLLGSVRREKEEKAMFFEALEALNRTTVVSQAAQVAVEQAQRMCPALDLCALTLFEHRKHRVAAVLGEAAAALQDLSFADNAGLVSNVVKLGAPLPGRDLGAMDRVVIFDGGTVVRGLKALKIFPLRAGETTVGTLVCGSNRAAGLPEAAQKALGMLALQAAAAIQRTRLYEETQRLATTDGLTGLLNRRTFNTVLERRFREADRYRRPLSLLLLDIDHFKKVNDTYGHPAGDAVLRGVAQIAQSCARETDAVARYGGEELAIILPETDAAGARAVAERLRKAVEAAQHPTEQGALRVTVSIGLSTQGNAPEELIEGADKALYKAKQGGRNRVEEARGRAAA